MSNIANSAIAGVPVEGSKEFVVIVLERACVWLICALILSMLILIIGGIVNSDGAHLSKQIALSVGAVLEFFFVVIMMAINIFRALWLYVES